ncbi:DNA polymerase IV [Candidatus Uabimicrobium amorphum]|uniref:DNA polymerase IV n=1 Tax=Uabimicrobium amorphum TaxID=2596890 RepID=A0A5S9IQ98_UABAM|nr:DNA polymerase IV [Candidatus Uabimicrobium amorphum]BBM85170.1 DNA polymerase IV [Candidatus Uabimicrobium amorphum]
MGHIIKKIIHIDMDMFFAAIEIRDHPQLRYTPVVVGGKPNSRGVVATANYEARKYGIRSAMPCREAYKRCPHCVFIRPRMEKYREVSRQIRDIFYTVTDMVEPLSLDEAYLDVTQNKLHDESATRVAQHIKKTILATTHLTASAGVAPNKFVAKIASDYNKPDGLCVVAPPSLLKFIHPLPVSKVPGVGKITNEKLQRLQIKTIADLSQRPLTFLIDHFGKFGVHLHNIARGVDEREVVADRIRKSYGRETTFSDDITDMQKIHTYLCECSQNVFRAITKQNLRARTATLKIKYHDFQTITRRSTKEGYFMSAHELYETISLLLQQTKVGETPIRLAGVSVSSFEDVNSQQLYFDFDDDMNSVIGE